jgi:hypothetical protein
MDRDKQLHLIGGFGLVALLAAVLYAGRALGYGWALALGCAALALGVEWYQRIRREGTFSLTDAAWSAAPGVLIGAAWELAL